MDLNNENLKEIERLAYRYMLLDEIAIIMGCNVDNLKEIPEAINEFDRGRLLRKADFNGKIIELSNQLSSPAMNIEAKMAEETFLKDKLNR